MKKILFISLSILLTLGVSAQIDIDKSKINPAYLKFLPSNANPEDLRPSDIPSEQVLKQMGLSENEITEAMDFKFSRGKYAKEVQDTSSVNVNLSKFYKSFGDTLVVDTTTFPKARIFGQDVFRNNKLSFYQKALDAKAPENYKVGSGDEISISVWGYSEFSETILVDDRGYITPSSYGRIYVKGLTFKKMRSLLKSKFSTFLDMKNSEIDVTLSYSRVITVNIVGEVYNPGSYTIPAINTAFNALIAANGPNQLGSVRNIYIKRNGKIVDSLDVYQFLFNPTRSQDIYMQDGDYLFVPPAKNIIEIKGAVNRPYTYEAKTGESIASLIKYAGGYTTNAFTDVLTLKRIDYNTIKVKDVHKDHAKSTVVQHGDDIVVNTISNKLSNVVSVKGSIGVAGDYEFITMLCKLDFQAARYTMSGEVPSQAGNNHPTLSPMGVFDSADGRVNLAASTDKMFRAFCEIMQADELAANADYETVAGRLTHREALWHQVNLLTRQHATRDLIELLNSVGIPCGPINTIEQAFEDEQDKFLALTKQASHATLGKIDLIRSPINLSRYSHGAKFDRAGPELGEHSIEILKQLDYSDERIEALVRDRTVITVDGATKA